MEDNKSTTVKKTVKSGITFGSALAMVISYTTWKSVGRAIFMDYLVGCMSYIFFCVTNFLFEKFNGVGHPKFQGLWKYLETRSHFSQSLHSGRHLSE